MCNKKGKESSAVMRRLIDTASLSICMEELSYQDYDESESSLSKGNYIDYSKLLETYGDEALSDATLFVGTFAQDNNLAVTVFPRSTKRT